MTDYRVNKQLAHKILEQPVMGDIIERQGGLKDSYTKSELLRMLFPAEINMLINQGALIGPPVRKNESTGSSNVSSERAAERRNTTERRNRLAEEVLRLYFDGRNPTSREVYLFLSSPEYESLGRSVYPTGVQLRQVRGDLAAISRNTRKA